MSYYRDWTKGMVHVGYAERLYRLPPGDPPQILKKEDMPTYNTLVVGWHTTDYPTIAATFAALGGFYDSSFGMWIFQESEHAPAPSNHPPPENDDDPTLRPLHRTFNVPKTVPIGTHDKILFFIGGIQRCDLPTYCRPMLLDIAASADGSHLAVTSNTVSAATATSDETSTSIGIAGRRRKAARTETSTAPGASSTISTRTYMYLYSKFSSGSPFIPCIESRVHKGAAKGLSADVLRELLTLRSATAVTGSKSSQASSLLHMGSRDAYHTFAYRKYVYSLVEKGEMQLVTESQPGSALSVEAALASLPWNAHGEIKMPSV